MEREGIDSVEEVPFSIEDGTISTESKVDLLIQTAIDVKKALNRRSMLFGLSIVTPLVVGAILLFNVYRTTQSSEKTAQRAFIQSIENNRTFLQYRRDFGQTRDCPVEYFKELLNVSRDRGDLTQVQPPCEPIDTAALDQQIAELDKRLTKERSKNFR